MIYKAENIDTDKAIGFLNNCIEYSNNDERLEREKIQEYYRGFRDGIERAKEMFYCCNYEKKERKEDERN